MKSKYTLITLALSYLIIGCQKKINSANSGGSINESSATSGTYVYDSRTGHCSSLPNSPEGYHPEKKLSELIEELRRQVKQFKRSRTPVVLADVDVSCMDLSGLNLSQALGDRDYPKLVNWNFSGARFDNTDLSFMIVENANLRGTKIVSLVLGYSHLEGKIDEHTVLAQEFNSFLNGDHLVIDQ